YLSILSVHTILSFFFFTDAPPSFIFSLSLHDALPISSSSMRLAASSSHRCLKASLTVTLRGLLRSWPIPANMERSCSVISSIPRSEEHTSELQSRFDLVCRLLLEKKKD